MHYTPALIAAATTLSCCVGLLASQDADAVAPPAAVTAAESAVAEAGEWHSLIGEGLDGWTVDHEQLAWHWKNVDGVIVGRNSDKRESHLWTDADDFKDFELVVEYLTPSKDYDSGVFCRAGSHQVQIGVSRSLKRDMTGSIYAPADGDGGYPAKTDEDAIKEKHKPGEWNTLRIVVRGSQMQTFLNGAPIVDYPAKTIPESGKIGLQLHGGVDMEMRFRVVKVRAIEE